jgi:hypothetical protein
VWRRLHERERAHLLRHPFYLEQREVAPPVERDDALDGADAPAEGDDLDARGAADHVQVRRNLRPRDEEAAALREQTPPPVV